MNKEQIFAIIQRGHLTDGDLADALLAELAKISEPVGFAVINPSYKDQVEHVCKSKKVADAWLKYCGDRYVVPMYSHPLPQPDLVAEVERLRNEVAQLQRDQEQYGPDKVAIQKQAWVEAARSEE